MRGQPRNVIRVRAGRGTQQRAANDAHARIPGIQRHALARDALGVDQSERRFNRPRGIVPPRNVAPQRFLDDFGAGRQGARRR